MPRVKKKNPEHEFKVNTPQFLREIFDNNAIGGVFYVPANVFRGYLIQIAQRAAELNDPKLNAIMCQMALYDAADPYSPGYDKRLTKKTIKNKYVTKQSTKP